MNISQLISIIFFILVILIMGFDIIKYGLSELLEYEVKIEFLVTISTIGACLLGNFAEGAVLMLLFFIAEYLEDFALDQSKKSMVDLVKLRPDIACVKRGGHEIIITSIKFIRYLLFFFIDFGMCTNSYLEISVHFISTLFCNLIIS